jgi:hypothetical protein
MNLQFPNTDIENNHGSGKVVICSKIASDLMESQLQIACQFDILFFIEADTFNSAPETGFDDITNILERSFLPIRWGYLYFKVSNICSNHHNQEEARTHQLA